MKRNFSQLTRAAVCLLLVGSGSGCSFTFVKTPATDGRISSRLAGGDCTSSQLAPVLDTVFTGLQVARVGMAATARSSAYKDAPISRGADIALGAGFIALFASSAVYGFVSTSKCSRLQKAADEDIAPDPVDTWSGRARATRPTPASSPSPRPSVTPPPPPPSPAPEPLPATDAALPAAADSVERPAPTNASE